MVRRRGWSSPSSRSAVTSIRLGISAAAAASRCTREEVYRELQAANRQAGLPRPTTPSEALANLLRSP